MLPPPSDGSGSPGAPRQAPDDQDNKAKLDDTVTERRLSSAPCRRWSWTWTTPRSSKTTRLRLPQPRDIPDTAPQECRGTAQAALMEEQEGDSGRGGAGLLLLIALITWWYFIRDIKSPQEEAPPPEPAPVAEPEKTGCPACPAGSLRSHGRVSRGKDRRQGGVTRLLSLKIKLVYKEDPRIAREIQSKSFALRDGLYYNLRNKSFANLTDKDGVEQLREELRGVVNNYLNAGQVDQVLFEELLVK